MKTIKKLKNNMKTVAGSALLVGATLTAGAAAVTAQDSGSSGSLSDYPSQFVTEDGEVDTSIVVGKTATDGEPVSTLDVVGAAEIAGSLANNAFVETEESISVEGGSAEWTAQNGAVLNTAREDLYFSQQINTVRETLTDRHLDNLAEVEFEDDDGSTSDIRYRLDVGSQSTTFGKSAEDLDGEDPALYVPLSEDAQSSPLFTVEARMNPAIDFSDSNVQDEQISLFGQEFTIAEDQRDQEEYLTLFGSDQRFSVSSGEEYTLTGEDGEEQTVEVLVVSNNEAQVRVNGQRQTVEANDDIRLPNGETLRVSELFADDADLNVTGEVEFAIGSNELNIPLTGGSIEDGDGDEITGTHVSVKTPQDNVFADGNTVEISEISVSVGAEDADEQDTLQAGQTYSHSLFPEFEVHYGGQAPDVTNADQEGVTAVSVDNSGEDAATVDMTYESGDSATFQFATVEGSEQVTLSNEEDDIQTIEGEALEQDEYFTAAPGEFSRMFEVTSVDIAGENAEDAEVEIEDVFTGESYTINSFQYNSGNNAFEAEEVIDGQTYYFSALSDSNTNAADEGNVDEVHVTWGDNSAGNVDFNAGSAAAASGDERSVYSPVYTEVDSAVAMSNQVDLNALTGDAVLSGSGNTLSQDIRLPSTPTSPEDARDITEVSVEDGNSGFSDGTLTIDGSQNADNVQEVDVNGLTVYADVTDSSNTATVVDGVDLSLADPDGETDEVVGLTAISPEDESDAEYAYTTEVTADTDEEVSIGLGSNDASSSVSLESDDDVNVGYDQYGNYHEVDSADEGSFTLHTPAAQATAGAAITGEEGSLSSSGGASGSVTSVSPTYSFADAYLDTDVDAEGDIRQSDNLILVGGPSVNSLVAGLAEDNMTMTADEYTAGQGMIQHIPDAFSDGQDAVIVAGHSGDDTRAAAEFLANYRDNQADLTGESVTIDTESQSVVQ